MVPPSKSMVGLHGDWQWESTQAARASWQVRQAFELSGAQLTAQLESRTAHLQRQAV